MGQSGIPAIADDQPLRPGGALALDRLHRANFAAAAIGGLSVVDATRGVVLSVEGPWGSGKTSTLALIEELLASTKLPPVLVRFNPWLIGDRDSLLRQFLSAVAASVKLTDSASDGKRVAKELKTYAKAFDVLKFVPGAEPWASIIKGVIESTGEATGAVAEYKTPDIEKQKNRVEDALRSFSRKVIVFIDDIDRLFPAEVFEMVRIIKSVGDLPNVGYVVAWDPKYVVAALSAASIPRAESYLDKVVQVRLPLPTMSLQAKASLIDAALARLDPDALKSHFPLDEHRLSALYWSGLRELLEQPRDVTRVFNTVALIEPRLRGEVVFGDVVGLAALMVKAPSVFEVLKREPRWFVGNLPADSGFKKDAEVAAAGQEALEAAIAVCEAPHAVRELLNQMFPLTAERKVSFHRTSAVEGYIASAARLMVALQLSVSESDVSFVGARRYLRSPHERAAIAVGLKVNNCFEFLESLGDVAVATGGSGVTDIEDLCLDIGRLVDGGPFPLRAKDRSRFFLMAAEDVAMRAIELIVKTVQPDAGERIAVRIMGDPHCLTTAIELFTRSFIAPRDEFQVVGPARKKESLRRAVSRTVINTALRGTFFETAHPGFVLFRLPEISPALCRRLFKALHDTNPSLDEFATSIMSRSFDSNKGQIFAMPKDGALLQSYAPLKSLKKHAEQRLLDTSLRFPARAAWQALVEERAIYGIDGSEADSP